SRAAGVRFVHVPYQGMSPAFNDLLGGHVETMFDTPGNVSGHVREGKVKLLAVTGAQRLPAFPNTPTLAEIMPGVDHEDWCGVVAPPKTPREIAPRLPRPIAEALTLPDAAKRSSAPNFRGVGPSPAETAALIKSESEKFRQVITAAGIKVE